MERKINYTIMTRYIDKDALVAEIDRLDALYHISKSLSGELIIQGLFCFLDALEVKEVDLDKILTGFMNRYAYENSGEYPSAIDIAKHFFELGLKAQKGE